MAHISIYSGFFWSAEFAPDEKAFSLASFKAKGFLLRLSKGSNFSPKCLLDLNN